MSWTTPPTFLSGAILTAAEQNILSDDLSYLKAQTDSTATQRVYLTRTANLSLTTGVYTAIPWGSAVYDLGGWWTSGTNIVVPAGAIPAGFTTSAIDVWAKARFASNNAGVRFLRVLLNGTVQGVGDSTGAVNGDTTDMSTFSSMVAAAGDIITVQVAQSSGGSLNATQMQALVVYGGGAA